MTNAGAMVGHAPRTEPWRWSRPPRGVGRRVFPRAQPRATRRPTPCLAPRDQRHGSPLTPRDQPSRPRRIESALRPQCRLPQSVSALRPQCRLPQCRLPQSWLRDASPSSTPARTLMTRLFPRAPSGASCPPAHGHRSTRGTRGFFPAPTGHQRATHARRWRRIATQCRLPQSRLKMRGWPSGCGGRVRYARPTAARPSFPPSSPESNRFPRGPAAPRPIVIV